MDVATNTVGPKEIKLNPPKTFDGSREKFRKFLQDAQLYMTINKKIYDNDLVNFLVDCHIKLRIL